MLDYRLGCRFDATDPRDNDFRYMRKITAAEIPEETDFEDLCPGILDQGNLGYCVWNGISGVGRYIMQKEGHPAPFWPSRLYGGWWTAFREGTVGQDVGFSIRDSFKVGRRRGFCPETLWPYVTPVGDPPYSPNEKFAQKPPPECDAQAKLCQMINYRRVVDLLDAKACMAEKIPVVFGFEVFESIYNPEVAETGIIPMPNRNERSLGGHCVDSYRFSDYDGLVGGPNSWGMWGNKGFYRLPYGYWEKGLVHDMWMLELTEVPAA
ncbi:MAG: C1 family peptidase [Patescibacteria group bacterium]